MDDILKNLNLKQKEAVLATEGPVLILSGPGSGKTKTITHRIAYLIHKGVPPERILAITFTNKAADEMKTRINRLLHSQENMPEKQGYEKRSFYQSPFVGTFHAFSARILRTHAGKLGFSKTFTIFDEDDSLSLLKEVMKEKNINPKQYAAGMLKHTISGLKNELITPQRYEEETGLSDLFPKIVHMAYAHYQKRIFESNAMDFDDLLLNAIRLLENHPAVLSSLQNHFHFINVDEYQDVNTAQYRLIRMLAEKHRNIAVIGDDAQAIYSFRGADMRNILSFEKDWPDAKIFVLDQNYRSTQTILDAARGIIEKNPEQKQKSLWTENGGGECIRIIACENEREEAERIAQKMEKHLQKGRTLRDCVVLYRTNAQSRAIEEALIQHGFPYKIIGGTKFYQRKEIKDILCYIRFFLNAKDLVSLRRIINIPPRGIGSRSFLLYASANNEEWKGGLPQRLAKPLEQFDNLAENLRRCMREQKATDFIKHLLKTIRYQEYLDDSSANAEERWENVKELVSIAQKYDDGAPPTGLETLLEEAALVSDTDAVDEEKGVVHLMTLHAAKGLEFPIVFMIGLEEGIFPHARALFNPADIDEERRLCYVGLTRAKEKVFLSFAFKRTQFGSIQANPPSRFLREIPERLMELDQEIETLRINNDGEITA